VGSILTETADAVTVMPPGRAMVDREQWSSRFPPAAWLLVSVCLSFAVRWPFLNLPLTDDEGGYAYVADRWLSGRGRLYHDLWLSRPQGILLAYGLIFHTLGRGADAIRIGAAIVAAATMLAVWLFAQEWGGPRVAIPAALMFAVVSGSPAVEGVTANAEVFMALPAAYAAWLVLRSSRRGWGRNHLLTIGALAGLSTLLKPTGVMILPVSVAFLVWSTGDRRAKVRRSAWVLLGFAATLTPAAVHGWMLGWHSFVYAVIRYRLQRQSGATIPIQSQATNIGGLFIFASPFVIVAGLALVVRRRQADEPVPAARGRSEVAIVAWFNGPRWNRHRRDPNSDARTLLVLWLLGALAGVAVGGGWFPHYLLQAAAPFAIWFATTVRRAANGLERRERRRLIGAIAVISFAPVAFLPVLGAAHEDALLLGPGYGSQTEVAAYVRDHTAPETPIYVAFAQPSIYYFADRPAADRYLFDREVSGLPGVYDQVIAMISAPTRPRYVIGSQRGTSLPDGGHRFWQTVAAHYHLETTIGSVPIYRANASRQTVGAQAGDPPSPNPGAG